MSKQRSFITYRQMFPEFVYERYEYHILPEGLRLSFEFRLGPKIEFKPEAFFPRRDFIHPELLTKSALDSLVFHIGMIELISYWKATCAPTVVIKPYKLTDDQISFWKKLYYNGLGEFFYVNSIETTEEDFMTIRSEGSDFVAPLTSSPFVSGYQGHIVPIGGGKDSVVTLELLTAIRGNGTSDLSRPMPLIMNPRGATKECIHQAGYTMDEVLVIERKIHPQLLELNKKGVLNGHTPFSAMLAFYTLLASALTGDRPFIALSNENSANESTVADTTINHQYSKSLEFENDFRAYVQKYIHPDFYYYSFLRPLSELQIGMLFSHYPHYFNVFKSCNVGSKTDVWCGHCAKCLFAYIILSPFIAPSYLQSIFGKDMLDDLSLAKEFAQLRGVEPVKPFECVGTIDEVNTALTMANRRWYSGTITKPRLLSDFTENETYTLFAELASEHNVPQEEFRFLLRVVHDSVREYVLGTCSTTQREQLISLLDDKEILIAGYGREGKSTERLLSCLFPDRHFSVARNNEEIRCLLESHRFDMIFKSPGIPLSVFDGLCDSEIITSQCDVFLQVFGSQTIGITGTKGKTTTTQMIYQLLQSSYKKGLNSHKPILVGNMGIPFFDVLHSVEPDSYVVAELSCHQLEQIHKAPHIAILLNLYQEHLDHYRSYDDYMMAKMQIALNQVADDVFIYSTDNDDINRMIERCGSDIVSHCYPYSSILARQSSIMKDVHLQLVGEHNFSNAYAVSLVGKSLNIDDSDIAEALSSFTGLEHRLEKVSEINGVTFYNDSISTIPQSTIAAVEALEEVDTLILGGMDRGIDYFPLVRFLSDSESVGSDVRNIVLWGGAGKSIYDLMSESVLSSRNLLCHFGTDYSMEEAVQFALRYTQKSKICLLSPAASSYDHYKNFEYRGRDYKDCISRLS